MNYWVFLCSSMKGWGQIKVQLKVKTVSELVSLSSLVCYNSLHEYYQQKTRENSLTVQFNTEILFIAFVLQRNGVLW